MRIMGELARLAHKEELSDGEKAKLMKLWAKFKDYEAFFTPEQEDNDGIGHHQQAIDE